MTDPDQTLLESWHRNARGWTAAVREARIGSRVVATDQAIVDAVLSLSPQTVMDIGCGEGWLARALAAQGIAVTGFDAVDALVNEARLRGGGFFYHFQYDDFSAGKIAIRADVLVCNFSLLGKGPDERLVAALPARLNPGGHVLIQTVHPDSQPDQTEGWRSEHWTDFGDGFEAASPWYYRSPERWQAMLISAGFGAVSCQPVRHPETGEGLSVILSAAL